MKRINFKINGIPAVLFGEESDKLFLFIHGKNGCKEEAEAFADIACGYGYQVAGIDLPEHGERKNEGIELFPWNTVPELKTVYEYFKEQGKSISVRANSIGAWFSMLSFYDAEIKHCLFVSPILDMIGLIEKMMKWAAVDEKRLEKEKIIKTSFGDTLYWEYYQYVRENPITKWNIPTDMLYAEKDELTDMKTLIDFSEKYSCSVKIMKNGEHWFHTKEQIAFLNDWTESCLKHIKEYSE